MAAPETHFHTSLALDTEKDMAPSSDNSSLSSSEASPVVPVHPAETDLEKVQTHHTQHSSSSRSRVPQRITTAQDWTGPDDEGDPHNWSTTKKSYHLAMMSLQCFTVTFGSSVISPAIPDIADHFNVSLTAAVIPLTLYVLGLAFGPMISAPISETYGHRPVYLFLFLPSVLFSIGAAFSPTFAGLCICRLLAGLLGSGSLAVGTGTASDMYVPRDRALASSVFLLTAFLGPAFGPSVGGYVGMLKGYRWTLYCHTFIGAFAWLFGLFQSETYKKIILQQRAKKLGLPPPPSNLPPGFAKYKILLTITLLRPARMLVTEPIVAYFSIYTAFNFAMLFAFFAAFPLVFSSPYPEIQVYHFNRGEGGLVFLGIGTGSLLAALIFMLVDRLTYQRQHARRVAAGDTSPLPPEERLHAAKIGAFLLPIALFWFGWTARSDVHWISPVLATVFLGAGNLLVFSSVMMFTIDTYGSLAGASAAAANGVMRYGAGAVFPLFTVQMYRGMGVAWATSLLGFITIALCALPFIFYGYGPAIRARSTYAPH